MTQVAKYPVPRLADQIVREWSQELAEHFGVTVADLLANSTAVIDFASGLLRLELMDGSVVQFEWALHIVSEEKKAVAVFTEHCGHHVFLYHEVRIFQNGKLIYLQSPNHQR